MHDPTLKTDVRPRTGAGYRRLNTEVGCVITRFHLRSVWSLPWMWLAYLRIRWEARQIQGLLRTAFLVEGPRTCYLFSIWADDRAIKEFGTRVDTHVQAARLSFQRTFNRRRKRAEVWSTQWRLWGVSNNLQWDDFDLREAMDPEARAAVDDAKIEPGLEPLKEVVG